MKPRLLPPPDIAWDDDGTARSLDVGDVYHPRAGAAAQARHVFLQGNGLPERWRSRDTFTVLETGFGLGHNFLTTWRCWRDDPQRSRHLVYVAIDVQPPTADQLRRAHTGPPDDPARQLIDAWPVRVPGLHLLDFADGALRLMLAFGDVRTMLPDLHVGADAFYLDGFAPARNPEMWERHVVAALGRRARPGATAATWCVARGLRDAMATAGFECRRVPGTGGKREVLHAVHRPRPRQHHAAAAPQPERVVVVGAGIAGAAVAAALARQGVEVDVVERADGPAQGSSGNTAGLFHATVHADEGPYARLFRAAALHTARTLAALGADRVPHRADGLLRLEPQLDESAMKARLAAQALPPELVQALGPADATRRTGTRIDLPAWWYPGGGWLSPAALIHAWLSHPRIRLHTGCHATALTNDEGRWTLRDTTGHPVLAAGQLVLAAAGQVPQLLASLGTTLEPLRRSRGQVTQFGAPCGLLDQPVAGGGYAVQLPDGTLLCGATAQPDDDDDPHLRLDDQRANLARLRGLCPDLQTPLPEDCTGRVGWRVQPADRLPLAGPVPAMGVQPDARWRQAQAVPREPGLHVLCGLGGRGLTLAPLLGELVAARITGAPWPLERSLVDRVDPARFLVRRARQESARDQ